MRKGIHTAVLLALFAGPITADDVFKVKSPENWGPNQEVCFSRKRELIACGKVISSSTYRIRVKNPKLAAAVRRGDRVYVQATGAGRQPSSLGNSYVVTKIPHDRFSFAVGGYATQNLVFPELHVQVAATAGFAVGLMPSYAKVQDAVTQVNALGTFLTFEPFFRGRVFEGPSLLLGGGVYSLKIDSAGATEGVWAPAGLATVGWRFLTDAGPHLGISIGAQYVQPVESQLIIIPFTRFTAIGKLDIGFAF